MNRSKFKDSFYMYINVRFFFFLNSFPPPFVTGFNNEAWLYNDTAKNWLNWLPADTVTTIQKLVYFEYLLFAFLLFT
jgi:hypothetical protein